MFCAIFTFQTRSRADKMDENHWGHESDENSSYEEVKEEYDEMVDEFSDIQLCFQMEEIMMQKMRMESELLM